MIESDSCGCSLRTDRRWNAGRNAQSLKGQPDEPPTHRPEHRYEIDPDGSASARMQEICRILVQFMAQDGVDERIGYLATGSVVSRRLSLREYREAKGGARSGRM